MTIHGRRVAAVIEGLGGRIIYVWCDRQQHAPNISFAPSYFAHCAIDLHYSAGRAPEVGAILDLRSSRSLDRRASAPFPDFLPIFPQISAKTRLPRDRQSHRFIQSHEHLADYPADVLSGRLASVGALDYRTDERRACCCSEDQRQMVKFERSRIDLSAAPNRGSGD